VSIRAGTRFTSRETLDEALHWLEALNTDDVSERKVLEWLAWYEAREENRRAFDEMQELNGLTRELLASPKGEALGADLEFHRWWHRCLWRMESWWAACFGNRTVSPLFLRRSALACGTGLTIALLAFVLKFLATPAASPTTAVIAPAKQLITAMALPDDSRIELSPRTAVAIAYSAAERRLEMGSGEANFVVAHQKERPFIVHLDALRVRAVGTQFNIHRAGDRVEVTVIEGKIDVYREGMAERSAAGTVFHVSAGNRFTSTGAADPGSLAAVDAHDALAWQQGRLRYVHVPLGTVIADVNRYAAKPIVIEDEKIEAIPYTGSVFVEAIDEWLGAIAKEFQLVIVTGADSTKLIASYREQSNAP
jgi:ferric-dicitrate binding protein FerR (iron transport regulator)